MRIATRKSLLAIKQAEMTKKLFEANQMPCEFVFMETAGDKMAHPLFSGKGIFIKELQTRLVQGTADIAVHSLKDLPVIQTPQLALHALLPRASKEDVLIVSPSVLTESGLDKISVVERMQMSFVELKSYLWKSDFFQKNKIGTSSLRRTLIVKQYFHESLNTEAKPRGDKSWTVGSTLHDSPQCFPLRGNVDSRLKKVRNNEYSCILLAKAGLERLHYFSEDTIDMFTLDPTIFIPAAGQGIIAIEARVPENQQDKILTISQKITSISACIDAGFERMILFLLNSDCYTPVGVHFNGKSIFVFTEINSEFLRCEISVSDDNLKFVKNLLTEHHNFYAPFFDALCKSELAQAFQKKLIEYKFL